MVSIAGSGVFEIQSAGFELYTPPTAFSQPPKPPHFVMLDDLNEIFYDVGYDIVHVKNTVPWTELNLHKVPDPAIAFLPGQAENLEKDGYATGMLVSIDYRSENLISARRMGNVNLRVLPKKFMNWSALDAQKGRELPEEMREGLLRKVWNRRPDPENQTISYATPSHVLDNMPRPWHKNGAALNLELDQRFVGALALESQRWHLRL